MILRHHSNLEVPAQVKLWSLQQWPGYRNAHGSGGTTVAWRHSHVYGALPPAQLAELLAWLRE